MNIDDATNDAARLYAERMNGFPSSEWGWRCLTEPSTIWNATSFQNSALPYEEQEDCISCRALRATVYEDRERIATLIVSLRRWKTFASVSAAVATGSLIALAMVGYVILA